MFRTILVAVDGSPNSNEALAMAIDLAVTMPSYACSTRFRMSPTCSAHREAEHLLEARSTIGMQILENMRKQVPAGEAEIQRSKGRPRRPCCGWPRKNGCDLIVMGSRGHSQLGGMLLGSVSNVVAQRAHCPVMIVHAPGIGGPRSR
ncbi:MAG: universal stress protein [Kouleothrix sp.]